jgi:hypothetical protein
MSHMKRYLEDRYGPDAMNWPEKETMHCKYPTERPNFVIISLPDCDLAFSYETLVGVRGFLIQHGKHADAYRFRQWLVAENTWGPTTGKHLNYLDNGHKEDRVDQAVVESVANDIISKEAEALLTDLHTAHDAAIKAFK